MVVLSGGITSSSLSRLGSAFGSNIGSFLGLGASALGGALGAVMNNKRQYHWQRDLIHLQNDLNVYNAQHAHQWEVEDLRAAGLNPILSATGGNGATANVSGSQVPQGENAVASAINNALAVTQMKNDTALRKAQEADYRSNIRSREFMNNLVELQGHVEESKVGLNNAMASRELANAEYIRNQAVESALRSRELSLKMPVHELANKYYTSDYAKRVEPVILGAGNSARAVRDISDSLHSVRGHFGKKRYVETFDQRSGYGYYKERRY